VTPRRVDIVGGGPGGRFDSDQPFGQVRADGPGSAQFGRFAEQGDSGGGRSSSEISTWVEQHFAASTVGGRTVYDLMRPNSLRS